MSVSCWSLQWRPRHRQQAQTKQRAQHLRDIDLLCVFTHPRRPRIKPESTDALIRSYLSIHERTFTWISAVSVFFSHFISMIMFRIHVKAFLSRGGRCKGTSCATWETGTSRSCHCFSWIHVINGLFSFIEFIIYFITRPKVRFLLSLMLICCFSVCVLTTDFMIKTGDISFFLSLSLS